jgi:hypothetical protein
MSPHSYSILVSKADKCRRGEASQWTTSCAPSTERRISFVVTATQCCHCVSMPGIIFVLCCARHNPHCVSVWTLLVAFLNNTNRYNEMSVPIFRYILKFKRKLDFFVVDVGKSRPSGINFFTECLNGVVYINSTTTLCTHREKNNKIKRYSIRYTTYRK